jgi:hypothetical protein
MTVNSPRNWVPICVLQLVGPKFSHEFVKSFESPVLTFTLLRVLNVTQKLVLLPWYQNHFQISHALNNILCIVGLGVGGWVAEYLGLYREQPTSWKTEGSLSVFVRNTRFFSPCKWPDWLRGPFALLFTWYCRFFAPNWSNCCVKLINPLHLLSYEALLLLM